MQIEFVTHSSIVYRHEGVHLICDPWLEGTAFDDGWALLSPPVLRPEDFAGITHLWFSHEHPDHFSPRSLSAIPAEFRRQITVLYHESEDGKVLDFCRGLGFGAAVELQGDRWLTLGPGFEILCDTWADGDDSWLLVRTPTETILNLNDCQVNTAAEAEHLKARLGPVDTLLTQFSVSAWDGNADDIERRRAGARAMLDRAVLHARVFEAGHVIPFASFIWCCHEENAYMNSAMVGVGEVARTLAERTGAVPIVMYPGDVWTVGETFDSDAAIARYARDVAALPSRVPYRSTSVPITDLQQIAARFTARLKAGVSPLRLRLRAAKLNALHQLRVHRQHRLGRWLVAGLQVGLLRKRPARIWVTDHRASATFDLIGGLQPSGLPRDRCDVELSSAALAYAFRFLWGGETLQVNGRFNEIQADGRIPLFDYLWLASALNHSEGARPRPL